MNLTLKNFRKKIICVTIGDIDGIGIHLLIKEFKKKKIKNFILLSNIKIFIDNINLSIKKINIIDLKSINKYDPKKFNILSYPTKNKYTNTLDSLNLSYKLTKEKYFIGILTLPLNKNKIQKKVDKNFIDQTNFFSSKENKTNTNMIFIHNDKFFIPLTIHIELKNVHNFYKNKRNVINKIENLMHSLKKDFKLKNPKIILAGINPHAGENNTISIDDSRYLKPLIKYFQNKKINIDGPCSGDGMINNYNLKRYQVFIFTYHDQALIPFKIISDYEGVNFTSNLSVIRTSPSHGTAENLINTNHAKSKGILNSFKLILKIYKNRQNE